MGVAVAPDNRILIANKESATVTVLDSNGRFLRTLQCNCAISGVYPLRKAVFRLTDGIDQTIYVLDASSNEERILFVPPPPALRSER
jgi:DNA-binding beta-propeller fold protein YncE